MAEPVIAFSYLRYSHRSQEEGDSVRRQTERAVAYCAKRGWRLDNSLKADRAVSAFRGKNALVGHLSCFLRDIEAGRVSPGSVLIVESVDRLSRQGIDKGYDLCKNILGAGVHIVTLSPEREYTPKAITGLMHGALELQIILERAAEESQTKSDRIGEAWARKKKTARATRAIWHKTLPAWCKRSGDSIIADQVKADAIRRIFELAASGYGATAIMRTLIDEGFPAFGKGDIWARGTVIMYLKDRRVLGECQPRTGVDHVPDGDPILGYFPRIVSDAQFYAARAGVKARQKNGRGRPAATGEINVFQGILRDARSRANMLLRQRETKHREGPRPYSLVPSRTVLDRGGTWSAFPYSPFEEMVLGLLGEVNLSEIVGKQSEADLLAGLEAELAEVCQRIASLEAQLLNGQVDAVVRVIRQLEVRAKGLAAAVEDSRASAAKSVRGSWYDFHEAMCSLGSIQQQQDAKRRVQGALRGIIADMLVLVVQSGLTHWCAVQVFFKEGKRRLYLLHYRRENVLRGVRTPEGWSGCSWPDDGQADRLDLRLAEHVADLEAELAGRDPDAT